MTPHTYTAFCQERLVSHGPLETVALAVKAWLDQGGEPTLLFEDETGQQIDLDLRGTPDEALERLREHPYLNHGAEPAEKRTGPGRPKLGVVSREVSLLPRHWDWLNAQPGGASVTLRKLVEETMKASQGRDRARKSRDALSRFLWAMAGNLPGFEEVARALTRKDYEAFERLIEGWPADVRAHVTRLLARARQDEKEATGEP